MSGSIYHQLNGFGLQVRGNYPDPDTVVEIPARNVNSSGLIIDFSLGNRLGDPLFVDRAAHDYHLLAGALRSMSHWPRTRL